MAVTHKHAMVVGALVLMAGALCCEAASGTVARRMAMGNMTSTSMDNLKGTTLSSADGTASYMLASRTLARPAYPWCASSATTAYFLKPNVSLVANTSDYAEYAFKMDENYGLCKEALTRKNKASTISKMCNTPFYSFMIAVSDVCHTAIMKVNTIKMFAKQNVAGANATEMYCHAHKGHDTGYPLLKYLIKPDPLTPSSAAGAKRSFVVSIRLYKRADNACQSLTTLCGGNTCMVALSDEEYTICPAFYSRIV